MSRYVCVEGCSFVKRKNIYYHNTGNRNHGKKQHDRASTSKVHNLCPSLFYYMGYMMLKSSALQIDSFMCLPNVPIHADRNLKCYLRYCDAFIWP